MGMHSKIVTWWGEDYERKAFEYQDFLSNALLYVNNVNGGQVFSATYDREFDPEDVYCTSKVKALQTMFDGWYLSLDTANRRNFVEAVMTYIYERQAKRGA